MPILFWPTRFVPAADNLGDYVVWSVAKGIVARLQKKSGVYDEQTFGHCAITIHDSFRS